MAKLRGYSILKDVADKGNYNFFIFVSLNKQKVLKIPKPDVGISVKIKDPSNFKKYHSTLSNLNNLPFLDKHICKLIKIYKSGSYTCEYIQGYNLFLLLKIIESNKSKIDSRLKLKITGSINELIISLKKYKKEYGYITGDWSLHDLVYSTKENRIINVDLEGFYTYNRKDIYPSSAYTQLTELKQKLMK